MVVLKTEVIDEGKSCVHIVLSCAEIVDFFGPVGGCVCVGYVSKVVVVVLCVK